MTYAFAFSPYGAERATHQLRGGFAVEAYNARKGKMGLAVYDGGLITLGFEPSLEKAQRLLDRRAAR